MEDIEIELSVGKITLRIPKAGQRNRALVVAETPDGIKGMLFMMEILPYCIKEHPFGITMPLKQALDNLSIEDYDLIVNAAQPLVAPKAADRKKLKPLSESEEESTDSTSGSKSPVAPK